MHRCRLIRKLVNDKNFLPELKGLSEDDMTHSALAAWNENYMDRFVRNHADKT